MKDTELKNKIKKLIKYRKKNPVHGASLTMKHPDWQAIMSERFPRDKLFDMVLECKQELGGHIKLSCCICQKQIGFIIPKKVSYAKLYNKDKYEIFCNDCYNTKYYY